MCTKDTSILNKLFQLEFDTELDLADIIHFINNRMDVQDVFPELTAEEATLLILDMGIEPAQMFSAEEMFSNIDNQQLIDEANDRQLSLS